MAETLRVKCGGCGRKLRIKVKDAGRKVSCPNDECAAPMILPSREEVNAALPTRYVIPPLSALEEALLGGAAHPSDPESGGSSDSLIINVADLTDTTADGMTYSELLSSMKDDEEKAAKGYEVVNENHLVVHDTTRPWFADICKIVGRLPASSKRPIHVDITRLVKLEMGVIRRTVHAVLSASFEGKPTVLHVTKLQRTQLRSINVEGMCDITQQ